MIENYWTTDTTFDINTIFDMDNINYIYIEYLDYVDYVDSEYFIKN